MDPTDIDRARMARAGITPTDGPYKGLFETAATVDHERRILARTIRSLIAIMGPNTAEKIVIEDLAALLTKGSAAP